MAEFAQSYIDSLEGTDSDVCSGTLVHSDRTGLDYGENLAYGTITAIEAIDLWYAENAYYSYTDPDYDTFDSYGHFTQLIWNSTTEVGCVVQDCPNSRIYVICEYTPQGNIFNADPNDPFYFFFENVFPPTSS